MFVRKTLFDVVRERTVVKGAGVSECLIYGQARNIGGPLELEILTMKI